MRDHRNLGPNIKRFRTSLGFTIKSFANLVGVGRSTLSRWEANKQVPRSYSLDRLTDALHCTLDELYLPYAETAEPIVHKLDVTEDEFALLNYIRKHKFEPRRVVDLLDDFQQLRRRHCQPEVRR